jgi:murein DD-endopeptidase MepM/ murein hydrolase activator NlpD
MQRTVWLVCWMIFALFCTYGPDTACAQDPVPFVNDPLVPASIAPGGPEFTLTVNGTGFVAGATVNWNGKALTTVFISGEQVKAEVPAANIATSSTASVTVMNPRTNTLSNVMFLSITSPTSALTFSNAPSSPISVGSSPFFVAVGDFNGDRKVDLAVTNSGDGTVTILLGNGNGTFTPALGSPVTVGSDPCGIAVGDFNGDGKLDLALTVDYNVTILLGNGNGTFAPAGSPIGVAGCGIAVGDFNGDGKLDLAVPDWDNSNELIFLGNGDGTFTSGLSTPSSWGHVTSVAVGDFNGDGKLDLAAAGYSIAAGGVTILLGNGDGTFTQTNTSNPTGYFPYSLVLADFNGDGKLDLAVANQDSATATILLGNGDGTFGPGLSSGGLSDSGVSLAAGDFNGDGRPDLVIVDDEFDNAISILLNTPTPFLLTFPLHGMSHGVNQNLTPQTAQINTVFDHMMLNEAGNFSVYGCDKNVEDFVGEVGNTKPSKFHIDCRHGYQNVTEGFEFLQGVANYSPSDPTNLYYDGHPGFDFQSAYGNQVYAAGSGTVSYPTLSQLDSEGIWVGGNPDSFNVMELDPGNGYKIFYLHLSTHSRNIATGPLTSSLEGRNFIATQTGKAGKLKPGTLPVQTQLFISGQVTLNGQPLPGVQVNLNANAAVGLQGTCTAFTKTDSNGNYMFVGLAEGYDYNLYISPTNGYTFAAQNPSALVPDGTLVSAGELIALSGDAGPCIPPHLHFEVQQKTSKVVAMYPASSTQTMLVNYVPVDPYGWSPSDQSLQDPYILIPELQGAGVTNLYIWK